MSHVVWPEHAPRLPTPMNSITTTALLSMSSQPDYVLYCCGLQVTVMQHRTKVWKGRHLTGRYADQAPFIVVHDSLTIA